MKIFVIIVTYNGEKWIEKCLDSLLKSTVSVNIVVIDNDSKDQTTAIIKTGFPQANLIVSDANLGFGRANNIGLKVALKENADYVFLLNQDTFIAPHCVEFLIQASNANKDYGILSPFHLSYSGDAIEEYFNKYIIAIDAPGYLNDLYFNNMQEIYPVSFIHAAGWLLPIDTVKKVGGFDPLFFHYGEDNDYVQRALFKNYKIGFVPTAIMFHLGTNAGLASSEKLFSFKRNFATIHLKNPKASFTGAMIVFIKGVFDGITSALMYRNMERMKEEWKLGANVMKTIRKIRKSRQIQMNNLAYLYN